MRFATPLRASIALAGALFVLHARDARAGNSDTFPLGNDAALLGGAATAATHGATATWYNPARITIGWEEELDVSASAYLVRFGGIPDLVAAPDSTAQRTKLATIDLNAVPTAVAFRRRIFGWDVGFGIFSPSRTVAYPRTLVRVVPSDGSAPTEVAIDGNSRFSEYYAGFGVGRSLLPGLQIGAAVFGYYSSLVDTEIVEARSASASALAGGTRDEQRFGAQLVLGTSWRASKRLTLGLTLRSPVLQIASHVQATSFSASQSPTDATSSIVFDERPLGADTSLLVPLVGALGGAIELDPNTTASADVSARGTLPSAVPDQQRKPVVNVRGGVRRQFAKDAWFGVGAFTDRSGARGLTDTSSVFDFYGFSLGLELGRPYRVLADGDSPTRTMRFATSIAASYAIGIGQVGNVQVSQRGADLQLEARRDAAVAHEIMLSIGSSIGSAAGF